MSARKSKHTRRQQQRRQERTKPTLPPTPEVAGEPAADAAADLKDPLLEACVALVPRLGAASIEVRYSEPEHGGSPVVWFAIAGFERDGQTIHQVGADFTPGRATYRLVEVLVDGGQCTHCKRPTGITEDFTDMPAGDRLCWYQLDPELNVFRRSCA